MASTQTANDNILNRLKAMPSFSPASGTFFADWTLDPGDIVTVEQDGKEYSVPIMQMNLDWKGQSMVEVQSTGSEKRPPLSALKRNSYGGSRAAAQTEQELVRHQADIEKSNTRLSLWATTEQWNEMAQQYELSQKSQFEITSDQIQSTVLETGSTAGVLKFDPSHTYVYGEKCIYNGVLYRCTNQSGHTGAWGTGADFATVSSMQSQIQQNAGRIALVVDSNGIRAGQIVLAINGGTGHSEALIEANQIQITGNTTLSGTMEIDGDGVLRVKKNLIVNGSNGRQISMNNGTISTNDLSVKSGGALTFVGAQTGEYYNLSASTFPNFIRKASLTGNTLSLWKVTDADNSPSITFSKATTVTGAWGSGADKGTYYAIATQNGTTVGSVAETPQLRLDGNGGDSFSAEMLNEAGTTVQSSIYGYLHQSGDYVNVYKNRSGSSYSGVVASLYVPSSAPVVGTLEVYPDPGDELQYDASDDGYDGYDHVIIHVSGGGGGGGSYTFSCTENAATWTQSIAGYLSCGAISKSAISAQTYLRFRIKCDNAYKYCYITVNP